MAEVRIGGEWVSQVAAVSEVEWTTQWGPDIIGGPWEASCNIDIDPRSTPWFLQPGKTFEVFDEVSATPVWGGVISEPDRGRPWTVFARGWGREADRFAALKPTTVGGEDRQPSTSPRVALQRALAAGLRWRSGASQVVSQTAETPTEDAYNSLTTLLCSWAKNEGVYLMVDSDRNLTATPKPTAPVWQASPADPVMGVADDDYVTHLFGRYVATVTGDTPPRPATYGYVTVGDDVAAARWGRVERVVDLTPLGLGSPGSAQNNLNKRFADVGARLGYTRALEVAGPELTTASGVPALRALGWVQAGQMLRLLNVLDAGGGSNLTASADIVIAETRYRAGEAMVTLTPEGLVPRDIASALAAAEVPSVETRLQA